MPAYTVEVIETSDTGDQEVECPITAESGNILYH